MEQNKQLIVKKILYVIVMPEESSVLLQNEKFVKDETLSGEYSNILESFTLTKEVSKENDSTEKYQIIIIRPTNDPINNTSLFGTEISFFISYIGLKHYKPDLIISLGYAGDTSTIDEERLKLGSVVIAKQKGLYHRREMIIKFYEKTSEGHYPLLNCDQMVKSLGFHSCSVGTSNSFCKHDNVAVNKGIKVVEMELCSVARAGAYFNVPCIGVKIISDGGSDSIQNEEEREKQFLESLEIMKNTLYSTFGKLNGFLLGKKIDEL